MNVEKVIAIIASATKRSAESITSDSTFDQLGLDSLDALNILHEMESEFNVRFPNEEVLGIRSVSQVLARLERFLPSSAPDMKSASVAESSTLRNPEQLPVNYTDASDSPDAFVARVPN
jgi:acyl carrier protein